MKLRCIHNSIPLRLRTSELDQLSKGQAVQEAVRFPNTTPGLVFALALGMEVATIDARLEGHVIQITLPNQLALSWINSMEVSIEANIPLDNGEYLHILVEKDFPCKDREGEDKSDLFEDLANGSAKVC